MEQYKVKVKLLNKRWIIPTSLPNPDNIKEVVKLGYSFFGHQVPHNELPNLSMGEWFQDTEGLYYWGGGLSQKGDLPNIANLTLEKVKFGTRAHLEYVEKFYPFILETLETYFINTPIQQLCFLSQIGHESGGLFFTEELSSGENYQGKLGNINPGDGKRYKGRGLIQITGRENYAALSQSFKIDFINHPEKLGGKNASLSSPEQLKNSALSAGWYWDKTGLNKIAQGIDIHQSIQSGKNVELYREITKRINGGLTGIDDRIQIYLSGLPYFL